MADIFDTLEAPRDIFDELSTGPSHGASGEWGDNEEFRSSILRPEQGLGWQQPQLYSTPPNRYFGPTPEERAREEQAREEEQRQASIKAEALRALPRSDIYPELGPRREEMAQEILRGAGIESLTLPPGQLPEVTSQELQTLGLPSAVAGPVAGTQQAIARLVSGVVGSPEGALFVAAPEALPPLLAAITPEMSASGAAEFGRGMGTLAGGGDTAAGVAEALTGFGKVVPALHGARSLFRGELQPLPGFENAFPEQPTAQVSNARPIPSPESIPAPEVRARPIGLPLTPTKQVEAAGKSVSANVQASMTALRDQIAEVSAKLKAARAAPGQAAAAGQAAAGKTLSSGRAAPTEASAAMQARAQEAIDRASRALGQIPDVPEGKQPGLLALATIALSNARRLLVPIQPSTTEVSNAPQERPIEESRQSEHLGTAAQRVSAEAINRNRPEQGGPGSEAPKEVTGSPALAPFADFNDPNAVFRNDRSEKAGLAVTSIGDLDSLLDLAIKAKEKRDAAMAAYEADKVANKASFNEAQRWQAKASVAREAIETATNSGSWTEGPGLNALGERPLDFRKNPEVAKWMIENQPKAKLSITEQMPEVEAATKPAETGKATPAAPTLPEKVAAATPKPPKPTEKPVSATAAPKDVTAHLQVPVPNVAEARRRVRMVDNDQARLRDEAKKLDDERKALDKVIKPLRGNAYARSKIKKSAKRLDVERYRAVSIEYNKIGDRLAELDQEAKADRALIDQASDAAVVNDPSKPLLQRLDRRIRMMEGNPPPELIAARDAETARLVRDKFPDATPEEIKRIGPELQREMYFGGEQVVKGWDLNPALNLHLQRRGEINQMIAGRSVPLSDALGERITKAKLGEPSPKEIADIRSALETETEEYRVKLAEEQAQSEAKRVAQEAKEKKLIADAQAVAASAPHTGTKGAPTAKSVKSKLVERIEEAMAEVVAHDKVKLEKREDGSYLATGESGSWAFGDVEEVGEGRVKVTTRRATGDPINVTVGSVAEAESLIKAMAAEGPGSSVIAVPGDGVYKLVNSGQRLLSLWRDAKGIDTSAGTKKAYATAGGIEKPPTKIKTTADWEDAKAFHDFPDKLTPIADWSNALAELAKKVNPEHPEAVTVHDVDTFIANKRAAAQNPPSGAETAPQPAEPGAQPPETPSEASAPAAPKWTQATAEEPGMTLKQLREGGAGERAAINVGAIAQGVADLARRGSEAVKRGIMGLNEVRREALTLPAHSDMRRNVMDWSATLQRSFSEADAAQKDITRRVRNPVRREGITNWIQAGGDPLVLAQRRADTAAWRDPQTGRPHPQANQLLRGYDAALNLTPEELAVAGDVKAAFDALGQRAQQRGVLNNFLDNYVTQIWDLKKGPQFAGARNLRDRFRFSKARTFDSYFAGEQAGFQPRTKDIAKLLPVYIHEMNQVLAARKLVADMSQGVASDGRPLLAPRGIEIPADDTTGLVLPRAPKVADTGDYKVLEGHPALSGWRWLSKDAAGKTRFIKSDLALHPEAFGRLRAALGKSAIREWYSNPGPTLASNIPKSIIRGLDNFQSGTKRSMLGLIAPFHQVQEGTHAIGHRVNPFFNIPKVDLVNNGHQMDAARHGLMLQPDRASQQQFMQGSTTAGGIIGRIPGIGKIAEHYSDYLFHQYIPGLKFKTYEAILRRNSHLYRDEIASGRVTDSDVKILSAQQANAAYGHLNYADMARNPTIQHIMQVGLLAPDFLEARARFSGQAIKGLFTGKVGREQLLALGTLALTQAVSSWTAAKLSGGEWDPKHPFEFRVGNRKYSMRSVPEDISGLITDWRAFLNSRLSPVVGKAGLELITGRDWAGRRVTSGDVARQAATQFVPLNLRGFEWVKDFMGEAYPNRLSTFEQLAGSLGLRISRYTEPQVIELGQLREWIETTTGRARSIPQDKRAQFIYDQLESVKPEYRKRAYEEIRRRGVMRGE